MSTLRAVPLLLASPWLVPVSCTAGLSFGVPLVTEIEFEVGKEYPRHRFPSIVMEDASREGMFHLGTLHDEKGFHTGPVSIPGSLTVGPRDR